MMSMVKVEPSAIGATLRAWGPERAREPMKMAVMFPMVPAPAREDVLTVTVTGIRQRLQRGPSPLALQAQVKPIGPPLEQVPSSQSISQQEGVEMNWMVLVRKVPLVRVREVERGPETTALGISHHPEVGEVIMAIELDPKLKSHQRPEVNPVPENATVRLQVSEAVWLADIRVGGPKQEEEGAEIEKFPIEDGSMFPKLSREQFPERV